MSSDRQRAASNAQKADELSQVLKPLRQKGRPFLNVSRETQIREILAKISRVIVHTTHCAHLASTFMARQTDQRAHNPTSTYRRSKPHWQSRK
jgi:hypothetical protein